MQVKKTINSPPLLLEINPNQNENPQSIHNAIKSSKNINIDNIKSENKNKKPEEKADKISIDEFFKVDLRAAKILDAKSIEKSKKLIKLTIDIGEDNPRTLVAGLKEHYSPDALIGKTIIVVANLKPAKLMGIESNGMLLAAKDGNGLGLLTTNEDVKPGAKVG